MTEEQRKRLIRLLQHHHKQSGHSYAHLAGLYTARSGRSAGRMTLHNRINKGMGCSQEVLRILCAIWQLHPAQTAEVFETAGYMVRIDPRPPAGGAL